MHAILHGIPDYILLVIDLSDGYTDGKWDIYGIILLLWNAAFVSHAVCVSTVFLAVRARTLS